MASSLLQRATRLPIYYNLCRRSSRVLFSSSSVPSPLLRIRAAAKAAAKAYRDPFRPLSPKAVKADETLKSVKAYETLKRVLDSEIDCAQQEQTQEVPIPDNFSFEIIDNPGDQTVVLKREFNGETIHVTVFTEIEGEEEAGDDEDKSEDENNDSTIQPTLSLVVAIDKGSSPIVEFCCNLNSDELSIESMGMKKRDDPDDQNTYQGPDFTDLEENLQKALHTYLEVRGITVSLFDFLQEYMMSKDDREYLAWLQNLKNFFEK